MIIIGQAYKHYKGSIYVPLFIAEHTETREKLVIYHNPYENPKQIWARPIGMWDQEVKPGVKRFTKI